MKAKAVSVTAWACRICRHLFPRTKHGKDAALVCCTCSTCGRPARRCGPHGGLCKMCGLKKMIEHNEQYRADVTKTLEEHKSELASLEAHELGRHRRATP